MSIQLPDWLRGFVLLGRTQAGTIVPVLISPTGQINILIQGEDVIGEPQTVRVDDDGQLYTLIRGKGGYDLSVDASGFLTAILKGAESGGTLHTVLTDSSGQIVMVPRGQSGNYMSVDANGYLTAVLKGVAGGTLTTIAVDANGRIDAFLMDGSDQWGQTLRIGNAELAARLNPLHTYDWRGNVIYECDFSQGDPSGTTTLTGTGAAIALTPEYWKTGGYSLKLTGGSTEGGQVAKRMQLTLPASARIGVQAMFSCAPAGTRFYIWYGYEAGSYLRSGGIAVNMATKKLEYWSSGGAWVAFQDIAYTSLVYLFHSLKVVVNGTTGKYVRGLFLNTEYDMSALSCQSAASVGQDYLNLWIGFYPRASYNDVAYLDSFVVTVNEPVSP